MDPMINAVKTVRLYRPATKSWMTYELPWSMSQMDAQFYIYSVFPGWEMVDLDE